MGRAINFERLLCIKKGIADSQPNQATRNFSNFLQLSHSQCAYSPKKKDKISSIIEPFQKEKIKNTYL